MYARQLRGDLLSFGVSGKLVMNGLVMYDRETDTLWSQVLGKGLKGRHAGVELERVPHDQMAWARWLELHPDTVVLEKGFGGRGGDPYESYYRDSRAGIIGETRRDGRLPVKEYVLGLMAEGQAKAYPFGVLSKERVVNDSFAGQELLVVFEPESAAAKAYARRIDGELLSFSPVAGRDSEVLVRDQESGSLWNGLTGEALGGPRKGVLLSQVPATTAFWFGWKDYHPSTEVYGDR